MFKWAKISLCIAPLIASACSATLERSQKLLEPDVSSFLNMLIGTETPSLAMFAQFAGECGGELELNFTLNECRSKGIGIYSQSCINFTQRRCSIAEQEQSLALNWLRERFATAGRDYRLVNVQSESERIELLTIEIGGHLFILFHDKNPYPPGGLVVAVTKVDGRDISDYF